MNRFFLFPAFFFLLFSCSQDEPPTAEGEVGIRIENRSRFTFDRAVVETGGGGEQEYLNIAPGAQTPYKSFDFTYRYAFIQVAIAGDTLTIQPIDYVGEQRFTEGRFTFGLDIIGESPLYLVYDFRED